MMYFWKFCEKSICSHFRIYGNFEPQPPPHQRTWNRPHPKDRVKISLWFSEWFSYFNTIQKFAQSLLDATQKYKMMQEVYRKIPNISSGLIVILKHIFRAYVQVSYIHMVFCVSQCVSRLLNLSSYRWNFDIFNKLPLFCFKTYLKLS